MAWNAVESNPTLSRRRRCYNKQNKPVLVTEEVKKYKETGTIADRIRPRSTLGRKLQLEHLRLIDEALDKDDEISSVDLCKMLQEKAGILVSISTVQRAKNHLG